MIKNIDCQINDVMIRKNEKYISRWKHQNELKFYAHALHYKID